ncbi:DNA damage-induced cell division inhibitor SosA [Mammaliicoccus sp. Dog046]|uniref:DNA damage-induced cell division inhibitor SosA n=1 Tax=Mammaliicoccus sp. Dog046 TaxID=3034233 RepID=UPI002B261258|nr:DNA damage-induced cell division inhibitor SosA [Mammaliicoccus sp. Dog046]WQK84459.1 DNA damage-induced cell division inhibitor SosA [Mammaliicoccus sp. Dog046]
MTITINKTILVYVAVFLLTILIGYLYLAQANDIYNTEQTYEMTDHQIQQHDKHETKQVADSNTLVGTIE